MAKLIHGENDFATLHPDLAMQWHPVKNEGLTASDVTANSHKIVWWHGACGHDWDAPVSERVRGRGCPICKGKRVFAGINDLATIHPAIAAEWNYEMNEKKPTEVLPQSNKPVWWTCEKGHDYQTTPARRVGRGAGCPICSNKQILVGFNDLATTHPELAAEWHPTKNELKPQEVTIGAEKKAWWLCNKGHDWEALVYSRQHSGCPYCAGNKVWLGFNDLATTHPDLAAELHPTKNDGLTAQDISAGSNQKVWWQGHCGHEWEAQVRSRAAGCGCPICDAEKKTSFPEKAILYYLAKCYDDATSNVRLGPLGNRSLDIFVPSLQTAVEYDGERWHQDVQRDITKNELCCQNGIRLIHIREPDCPELSVECILLEDMSERSLGNAIAELCRRLNRSVDVNIKRDRNAIYNTYIKNEKEVNLATERPDLASEWHPTNNGDLTPQMFAAHSNKIVWWRCSYGHEWQDSCNHRAAGRGCPECAKQRRRKKRVDFNQLTIWE